MFPSGGFTVCEPTWNYGQLWHCVIRPRVLSAVFYGERRRRKVWLERFFLSEIILVYVRAGPSFVSRRESSKVFAKDLRSGAPQRAPHRFLYEVCERGLHLNKTSVGRGNARRKWGFLLNFSTEWLWSLMDERLSLHRGVALAFWWQKEQDRCVCVCVCVRARARVIVRQSAVPITCLPS